ncbi:MAG TPA: Gfo/Idh/MocA family oxidoreductase, partial [Ilumatobacteraceae bacterium]
MSAPRVALWGAGMISGAHAVAAGALQLPITAVASRSVERATEQAERLHTVAARYEDLPGDADIVIVATPPQLHAEHALHLLAVGAAVVLEKPLCTTLTDADRLVAAAAAHGERLLYAENLAYAPVMTTLIRMAAAMGPPT